MAATSNGPSARPSGSSVTNRIHYLTPPPEIRTFGTWCSTVGEATTPPGSDYPPDLGRHPSAYRMVGLNGRVLEETQLVYVAYGRGTYEDSNGTRAVHAGDCLVLHRRRWHRYAPEPATGWHEFWVGVGGDAVVRALAAVGLSDGGPVRLAGAPREIVDLYERMLARAARHDGASHLAMAALVLELVALLGDESGGRAGGEGDAIAPAIVAMEQHLHEVVSMGDLAAACGLGESTFRRVFRAATGSAPYRYFMAIKVNAAKAELAHSSRPIKAIAARLGFTDAFHFSRVFKEYAGVPPAEWRRSGG